MQMGIVFALVVCLFVVRTVRAAVQGVGGGVLHCAWVGGKSDGRGARVVGRKCWHCRCGMKMGDECFGEARVWRGLGSGAGCLCPACRPSLINRLYTMNQG